MGITGAVSGTLGKVLDAATHVVGATLGSVAQGGSTVVKGTTGGVLSAVGTVAEAPVDVAQGWIDSLAQKAALGFGAAYITKRFGAQWAAALIPLALLIEHEVVHHGVARLGSSSQAKT